MINSICAYDLHGNTTVLLKNTNSIDRHAVSKDVYFTKITFNDGEIFTKKALTF